MSQRDFKRKLYVFTGETDSTHILFPIKRKIKLLTKAFEHCYNFFRKKSNIEVQKMWARQFEGFCLDSLQFAFRMQFHYTEGLWSMPIPWYIDKIIYSSLECVPVLDYFFQHSFFGFRYLTGKRSHLPFDLFGPSRVDGCTCQCDALSSFRVLALSEI